MAGKPGGTIKKKAGLTPLEARFVRELAISGDRGLAYLAAGYRAPNRRSAAQTAWAVLQRPAVAQALAVARRRMAAKIEVSQERVVRELARIAFGNVRELMSWGPDGLVLRESTDLSEDESAAVAEVTQTVTEAGGRLAVKQHDKLRALDMLARHLGLYPEAPPAGGGNIIIPIQIVVKGHNNI